MNNAQGGEHPKGKNVPRFPLESTRTYEVGELAWELKDVLSMSFRDDVWIRGQIRDLNRSAAGHAYFNLVTPAPAGEVPAAALRVVLFDSHRQNVNRVLGPSAVGHITDGVEVRIKASVEFWIRGGQLSLHMHDIDPEYTLEKLSANRDRLLADLHKKQLLERNRKLLMPVRPLKIGLVCSPKSAAYADFCDEMARSGLGWEIIFAGTPVQGFGSERGIAAALTAVENEGVDAIAVVRGGGSSIDLAAFDSSEVAYAIARCSVPVWTGIGHETDKPIADEVAHASFKTPTACAAGLVSLAANFRQITLNLKGNICAAAAGGLNRERLRLKEAGARTSDAGLVAVGKARRQLLVRADRMIRTTRSRIRNSRFDLERQKALMRERAGFRLEMQIRKVQALASRTCSVAEHNLKAAKQRLSSFEWCIKAHDPQRMMERGWTALSTEQGRLLRSVGDTTVGSNVIAQLRDGKIKCKVEKLFPDSPSLNDEAAEEY